MGGLTGLGACLLHTDPDPRLLAQVLRYLVRLTVPVPAADAAGPAAPGWWSSSNPNLTTSTPSGHGNFGMAHGISVISCVKSFSQIGAVSSLKSREACWSWLNVSLGFPV